MEKAVFTVGVVVVVAGTVFCLFYVLAAFAMCVAHKGRKPPFPTFAMFLLKFYRGMLTPIGRVLLGDGWSVEHAAISLANRLNSERYYKVGISDKIVILPQCLRDRDCKAKIDSKKGIECLNCGKCVVGRLKGAFPSLRVFVIPGGTFAKRVVEAENPKAVLGVACVMELYEGMLLCERAKIPSQGLELLRTGCIETAVDEKKLFELVSGRGQTESVPSGE